MCFIVKRHSLSSSLPLFAAPSLSTGQPVCEPPWWFLCQGFRPICALVLCEGPSSLGRTATSRLCISRWPVPPFSGVFFSFLRLLASIPDCEQSASFPSPFLSVVRVASFAKLSVCSDFPFLPRESVPVRSHPVLACNPFPP
ncbi:hypothetical protein JB92DRAFT_1209941 [Gautieria morchelliformis]|nr:hypothetical protein JB92DRAFT_1209941 [Gautieria morchelliformis]